jgi:tRNA threonylcarbamoyladenosine biosynthesis protein TsaE
MEKMLVYAKSELPEVIDVVIECLQNISIITLQGSLGAGKTTFSKALLKRLGVVDVVLSPTFTYVNEYMSENGLKIYHFDLYRLDSEVDFIELGFDEYLYQKDALVLIEWPEVLTSLLKNNCLRLEFDYEGLEKRCLKIIKE